jgi:hypothetical protein
LVGDQLEAEEAILLLFRRREPFTQIAFNQRVNLMLIRSEIDWQPTGSAFGKAADGSLSVTNNALR